MSLNCECKLPKINNQIWFSLSRSRTNWGMKSKPCVPIQNFTPDLFGFMVRLRIRTPWGPKRQFTKVALWFCAKFGRKTTSNQKFYLNKFVPRPKIHSWSKFRWFMLTITFTFHLELQRETKWILFNVTECLALIKT